jgi:hypothetical protein
MIPRYRTSSLLAEKKLHGLEDSEQKIAIEGRLLGVNGDIIIGGCGDIYRGKWLLKEPQFHFSTICSDVVAKRPRQLSRASEEQVSTAPYYQRSKA